MWLPAALVLNAAVILETLASSSNGSGGSAPSIAKQRTSCGRLRRRHCETLLVNGLSEANYYCFLLLFLTLGLRQYSHKPRSGS